VRGDGGSAVTGAVAGAVAILAGGRGQRLGGATKPLLMVGGRRIIDRQLAVLRPLFAHVVLVTAAPARAPAGGAGAVGPLAAAAAALGLPLITDRAGPGLGPLAGLDAALAWLPPEVAALVCVAGDMPYLAPRLLERLRDAPSAASIVAPRGRVGEPEPLCARYHRALAPLVAAQLAGGRRSLRGLLAAASGTTYLDEQEVRALDPEGRCFVNINTPADLASEALPADDPAALKARSLPG
jgi:molybdopterin-guanine dinucleotide biosynthesis protein A